MSVGTVTLPQSCSQPPRRASSTFAADRSSSTAHGRRTSAATSPRAWGRRRRAPTPQQPAPARRPRGPRSRRRARAAGALCDPRLVATTALRGVQRRIRTGEQSARAYGTGRRAHGTDRDRDLDGAVRADRNRRGGDRRPQPLDHRLELLVVPDLVEQHAELLAAPPRGHVTRTRGVLEAARDLAQHECRRSDAPACR